MNDVFIAKTSIKWNAIYFGTISNIILSLIDILKEISKHLLATKETIPKVGRKYGFIH